MFIMISTNQHTYLFYRAPTITKHPNKNIRETRNLNKPHNKSRDQVLINAMSIMGPHVKSQYTRSLLQDLYVRAHWQGAVPQQRTSERRQRTQRRNARMCNGHVRITMLGRAVAILFEMTNLATIKHRRATNRAELGNRGNYQTPTAGISTNRGNYHQSNTDCL